MKFITQHVTLSPVSIHVLAGRTTALNAFRYMNTNARKQSQPSQQKPAHVELCRGDVRLVLKFSVTATNESLEHKMKKTISARRKKRARPKHNFIAIIFKKSLMITQYQMRYAIYIPLRQ